MKFPNAFGQSDLDKASRSSFHSYLRYNNRHQSSERKFSSQQINIGHPQPQKYLFTQYLLFILPSLCWLIYRQLRLNLIVAKIEQYNRLSLPLFVGGIIWLLPHPVEVNLQGWHLLAIFMATIVSFITRPLPNGAVAIIALTVAIITGTLTIEQGLSGFSHKTAWLTVCSFLVARAIIKTGLGTRVAYVFITLFGKNSLLLSYGLLLTDLILSPVMPSGNARSGGVIFPIVKSLATAYHSEPGDGTERKIGSFLMTTAYQGTQITTALFLTAMVANPLMAELAQEIAGVDIDWLTWAIAASLPGTLSLLIMPLIVFWFYPPQLKSTPEAPKLARKKLKILGKIKRQEWSTIIILVALLLLWGWGNQLWGIESVTTSLMGVVLLIVTRVLTWKDIVREQKTWDIFIWFSILLMMATFLSEFGLINWVSNEIGSAVQNLRWQAAIAYLCITYFYSNYFFASKAARAGAMYPAFLSVAISLKTPPMYSVLVLAFLVNLSGCLTHYSTAEAPIYFGAEYIDAATWCKLGLYLSLVYLIVWTVIGAWWWQLLGLV